MASRDHDLRALVDVEYLILTELEIVVKSREARAGFARSSDLQMYGPSHLHVAICGDPDRRLVLLSLAQHGRQGCYGHVWVSTTQLFCVQLITEAMVIHQFDELVSIHTPGEPV